MRKQPFDFFKKYGYRRPRSVKEGRRFVTAALIRLREREANFRVERELARPEDADFIALEAAANFVQVSRVHHRLLVRELKRLEDKARKS